MQQLVTLAMVVVSALMSPTVVAECLNNADCASWEFCLKNPGDCTGRGDCVERPAACPDVWDPICGCDGLTYGNSCEANAAGVCVYHDGECAPPSHLGDMHFNGDVDFDDIDDFVLALTNESDYEDLYGVPPELRGDINADGYHDFDDIAGFVAILTGGSASEQLRAVPDPASLVLVVIGLLGVLRFGRPCRAAA